MDLQEYLPFWQDLTAHQRAVLSRSVTKRTVPEGTLLHSGADDCVGLFLVLHGMLRAYMVSQEGREVTLYRLLERDICLFSAGCMLNSVDFDIYVEAVQETEFLHIPTDVYQKFMQDSLPVARYTNELMASRFSDVMWLLDQVLNKKLDSRLAAFLLEESDLQGTPAISITQETIARHLGTAREVVTRLLRYMAAEELITLSRGQVAIKDLKKLETLAADSRR